MLLKDKVAVITGAATGIGRATALKFAREGATLVLGDVNEDALRETAQAVQDAGAEVTTVRCDVTSEEDVKALVEAATKKYGRLNAMFNNAGVANRHALVGEMDVEVFDRTLRINLRGVFLGCKYGAPAMAALDGGSIINTASVEAHFGTPGLSPYNSSKGGVVVLSKTVAAEYGARGVRCNAICPGLIATPMTEPLKAGGTYARVADAGLLKRDGRPEEVANVVAFLASDESSFVTGSSVFIDGGLTASINL